MGATYTRQSSSTIVDGATIEASHFNAEFDQILAAFQASSGHTHDGTANEGGPITKLLGNTLTFGAATAGTDITITFDGETSDGVLKWMEDEDYFEFSDDILVASTEKLQFRDTAIYINSSADGQLDLVADTEIQIAATTVDINGNVDISGTLTVAGALDFGDANISNIGSIALDTITNDGTDITLDSSGDIILDADGADITLKDGGTTFGSLTNSSGELVIKSGSTPTAAITLSGANATVEGNLTVDGNFDVTGTIDFSDSNITNAGSIQLDSIAGDADSNTSITFSGSDVITMATGGTTALTIDASQNVTIAGDLTVSGDDITLGTNTSGHIMVADGTNFNPVAVSGDVSIASNGAVTIASSAVENSMLAGSIADTKLNTISTAGKVALSSLEIDGGTDIGAALVDADLIVVDDGAGGTNRKAAMSRVATYIESGISGDITISSGTAAIGSGVIVNADINASAAIDATKIHNGSVSNAEFAYVNGVTSAIQTQIDAKAATTYVDNAVAGLRTRIIAECATTANVNLSNGLEAGDAIDGVTLVAGDRVLVKNQSTASENGLYLAVSSGSASRDPEHDSIAELSGGMVVVNQGSVNDNKIFLCTTDTDATLGSTSITYTTITPQNVGTVTSITAGTGLSGGAITSSGTIAIDTGTTVDKTTAQTLTNKTLTLPKINENVALTSTATELNLLDGVSGLVQADFTKLAAVTSDATELNILDGATVVVGEVNALDLGTTGTGTAIASKAVVLDGNKDYTGIRNVSLTGTLGVAGISSFAVAANVAQSALTSSSNAVAWDASAKPNAYHLTTENTTFSAPSNAVEGAFIALEINYNGSHTIAFNTVFEFAASTAPTFTSTDGKTDILVFRYNGAVWQEVGRTLNLSES